MFGPSIPERWRRANGGTGESTKTHRVAVFGEAADTVEALVAKRAAIPIEGRRGVREIRNGGGNLHRVIEIVVAGLREMFAEGKGKPAIRGCFR